MGKCRGVRKYASFLCLYFYCIFGLTKKSYYKQDRKREEPVCVYDIVELARRAQAAKPSSPPDHSIESACIFFGLGLAAALGIVAVILLWEGRSREDVENSEHKRRRV